jgi:hypothetical protein
MRWKYDRAGCRISNPAGFLLGDVYSGRGAGLNNPAMENIHNFGPIPKGTWSIGPFFNDPEKGPDVCHLTPTQGMETFGRSGFMIHGDNDRMNFTASEGCIVAARFIRVAIQNNACKILEVF